MAQTLFTDLVTLVSASWLNDQDADTYNTLSAVAGTNTITATGPTTVTVYAANQRFVFLPAVTNTAATTINISAIGVKNIFFNGAALSGGELVAGTPTLIIYDGTRFQIVGPTIGSRLTNSLGADVALTDIALYFTGPSVAQGTVGTWLVSGAVTLLDTVGVANFIAKLWDGTTVVASSQSVSQAANQPVTISLSGFITSPVGNLRISVRDLTSVSGVIKFNVSANSKDSTITAIRIA